MSNIEFHNSINNDTQNYFSYSGSNQTESAAIVLDLKTNKQTCTFEKTGYFSVKANEKGIYVKTDNLLVSIDPSTGEQTPLISTASKVNEFSTDGQNTIIAYPEGVMFFNNRAQLLSQIKKA